MISPRPNLHTLRETLGLTMGNVETASEQLARKHNNEEYLITTSRLSDFETKVVIPGIHRLYSLAIIDRREFGEMLSWYGVDLNQTAFRPRNQCATANPFFSCASKHHGDKDAGADRCQFRSAHNIEFRSHDRAVGHGSSGISAAVIKEGLQLRVHWHGSEDLTMHPILPPDSFIQVDESRNNVLKGGWRSECERSIYFIKTREGHPCSWCTQSREELILPPHPLSPAPPRVLPAEEAGVVGQVIGVAMRLGESRKEENDVEDHENGH